MSAHVGHDQRKAIVGGARSPFNRFRKLFERAYAFFELSFCRQIVGADHDCMSRKANTAQEIVDPLARAARSTPVVRSMTDQCLVDLDAAPPIDEQQRFRSGRDKRNKGMRPETALP